jgi:hypothetical protein
MKGLAMSKVESVATIEPMDAFDEESAERQCSRCRLWFTDIHGAARRLPEWWLCAPCHDVLLGSTAR